MDKNQYLNSEGLLELLESELLLNISKSGRIKRILKQVNSFLSEHPQNKKALTLKINCFYYLHKYNEALALCNTALTFHNDDIEILFKKVDILNALEKSEEAFAVLNHIASIDPDNPELKERIDAVRTVNEEIKRTYGSLSQILGPLNYKTTKLEYFVQIVICSDMAFLIWQLFLIFTQT